MGTDKVPAEETKQQELADYPRNQLQLALFQFQGEALNIPKTTKGYGYMYAPLDAVVDSIRPIMHKYGLMYTQFFKDGNTKFVTRLTHVYSGQMQDTVLEIANLDASAGKMNNLQALGATITYVRRYTLMLALGLVTEEDTDGLTGSEKKEKEKTQGNNKPQAPKVDQEKTNLSIKMFEAYKTKIEAINNLEALEETQTNFEEYVKGTKNPFTSTQVDILRKKLAERHTKLQELAIGADEPTGEEDVTLTKEEMDAIN